MFYNDFVWKENSYISQTDKADTLHSARAAVYGWDHWASNAYAGPPELSNLYYWVPRLQRTPVRFLLTIRQNRWNGQEKLEILKRKCEIQGIFKFQWKKQKEKSEF